MVFKGEIAYPRSHLRGVAELGLADGSVGVPTEAYAASCLVHATWSLLTCTWLGTVGYSEESKTHGEAAKFHLQELDQNCNVYKGIRMLLATLFVMA